MTSPGRVSEPRIDFSAWIHLIGSVAREDTAIGPTPTHDHPSPDFNFGHFCIFAFLQKPAKFELSSTSGG